ncbi:ferredoxin [Pseudonocardia sp.]|uniref:ferredoxin n=1 Tax=Pseudonocardia sp. TaxID=60912 RepID=UPI00261CE1B1|nr:ferredoxin [Pseudonocardia sp.]
MTRIAVDVQRCEGYANCVVAAPSAFDLDDDGKVVLVHARVAAADRSAVTAAVRSCPVAAIRLEDA